MSPVILRKSDSVPAALAWRENAVARFSSERAALTGGDVTVSSSAIVGRINHFVTPEGPASHTTIFAAVVNDQEIATVVTALDRQRLVVLDVMTGVDGRTMLDSNDLCDAVTTYAREHGLVGVDVRCGGPGAVSRVMDFALSFPLASTRMLLRLSDRHRETETKVTLSPMTNEEFSVFVEHEITDYARSLMSASTMTFDEAYEASKSQTFSLLSEGRTTPGHSCLTARDGENVVGVLWLFETTDDEATRAFVYDVEVAAEHRGRGYGRAIMRAASAMALADGCRFVELNVFGFNDIAKSLYLSLGYEIGEEFRSLNFDA